MVLFLCADPTDKTRLRLHEEVREIQSQLRGARHRRLDIRVLTAVRPEDLTQALLDHAPRIVHFSGHANAAGEICIEDNSGRAHPLSAAALVALFRQHDVEGVILNAPYSITQALALSQVVPFTVGIRGDAGSGAAGIAFAVGFYQALAAGRSFPEAFKAGLAQIALRNLDDQVKPTLMGATVVGTDDTVDSGMSTVVKRVQEEAQVKPRYNIVVIGKVGVGKSSLVNYLFGREVRPTGVGMPLTPQGFYREDFDLGGIPATLFDSWGLEVGRAAEWLTKLQTELNHRGTDRPAEEWFHTIFYCVAASGGRIEPFEIDIVRSFLDRNYRVVIVLTKADLAAVADVEQLRETITRSLGSTMTICEVCNVEKELRIGRTKAFGGMDLQAEIRKGFWHSISRRLPERCVAILLRIVEEWSARQYAFLETRGSIIVGEDVDHLRRNQEQLLGELMSGYAARVLADEVLRTVRMYGAFADHVEVRRLSMSATPSVSDVRLIEPRFELIFETILPLLLLFLPFFGMIGFRLRRKASLLKELDAFVSQIKIAIGSMTHELEKNIQDAIAT